MSTIIVVYRVHKTQIATLENEQGDTVEFNSESQAEKAVQEHDYIKFCEYELVVINL